MSLENHPNFHACKFVADSTLSCFESIRGEKIVVENLTVQSLDGIKEAILSCAAQIEDILDDEARSVDIIKELPKEGE